MKTEEQLKRWRDGESLHNIETDECCPDFSCCKPELKADQATRNAYYNAWESKNHSLVTEFLMGFLSALANGTKTHIAGQDRNETRH